MTLDGNSASGNQILGNFIGTKTDGTSALGNGNQGIRLANAAHDNTVGGPGAGQGNVIAFNTFDSRSAGHRFMKLRALLEAPAAACTLHPVQTRDALIDYFRRHGVVHKIARAGEWLRAA